MLVTKAITAADSFTPWVAVPYGKFNVSVSGTFTGTITVQRTFDQPDGGSVTALDVESFTAPAERYGENAEQTNVVWYRIGAKAAAWTSGTANVRLSR